MPDEPEDNPDPLDTLRQDLEAWHLDQQLDVAAEVYDPKRRNIHELEEDEMLDRFKMLLGFDVSWDQPAPAPEPPLTQPPPDEAT